MMKSHGTGYWVCLVVTKLERPNDRRSPTGGVGTSGLSHSTDPFGIYLRVWKYLSRKINERLQSTSAGKVNTKMVRFIGLLDIFGFEDFKNENGMSQLFINYTNEIIARLYNKKVLEQELAAYQLEGLNGFAASG